eukprot:7882902-Karenia_brevis.AAC.1
MVDHASPVLFDAIVMHDLAFIDEKSGHWLRAVPLLNETRKDYLSPEVINFNTAISSCEKSGHLTKAGHALLTCFDAIAQEAKLCLKEFVSQHFVNTVWAFACLLYTSDAADDM